MMNERKRQILKAVVHSYVRTAEPVASEQITSECSLGVKSATIRNEMAEMSDLGYLRQPHTSAGRIPSDLGYRFYVDNLMPSLKPADVTGGDERVSIQVHSTVDELVSTTCHLLAALTKLTALAVAPSSESINLNWIDLKKVSDNKALLITVWSNGQIRHAIVDLPFINRINLNQVCKEISSRIIGLSSGEIENLEAASMETPAVRTAEPFVSIVKGILAKVAKEVREREVFIDGASYFVMQPEFRERLAMELVLSVLEDHRTITELLEAAAVGQKPQVIIGEENPIESLRGCSFVAASYGAGTSARGSIGVCGPTRMDYSRAVAAVELMSQSLTRLLSNVLPS